MAPKKSKTQKATSARRRLNLGDDSAKDEVVDLTQSSPSPTKKREVSSFFAKSHSLQTPPRKSARAAAKVTPEEPPAKRTRIDKEEYVPSYIHKNVEYKRKGKADLSDETFKTYELVEKHFHIPDDLETNRKYGPLSGTSFEERVISAYSLNLLDPKTADSSKDVQICSVCAVEGHKRAACPQLI